MLKYAYADAHTWLMQVHLTFLSLSLTCNLNFCSWSFGGEWPLSPLGNSLLLRTELVPIHECWVYFPRPSHWPIPLKSGQGLAQVILLDSTGLAHYEVDAQYVPLQVLVILLFILVHNYAWTCYMHLCTCYISYFQIFLYAWFSCT